MASTEHLAEQLQELRTAHPDAQLLHAEPHGAVITTQLTLPPGWNAGSTGVAFTIPPAYPAAQPDCFYADANLRLASGSLPANTGLQPLLGNTWLWFSWHLQQPWQPNRHTLHTYVRFIEERLRRAN